MDDDEGREWLVATGCPTVFILFSISGRWNTMRCLVQDCGEVQERYIDGGEETSSLLKNVLKMSCT